MKIGLRTPNPMKSLKARTVGKAKRSIKKAVTPGYGQKGVGWIKNPKKAAYNKIYRKVTVSPFSAHKSSTVQPGNIQNTNPSPHGVIWWVLIGWWAYILYFAFIWWWLTPLKNFLQRRKEQKLISDVEEITVDDQEVTPL